MLLHTVRCWRWSLPIGQLSCRAATRELHEIILLLFSIDWYQFIPINTFLQITVTKLQIAQLQKSLSGIYLTFATPKICWKPFWLTGYFLKESFKALTLRNMLICQTTIREIDVLNVKKNLKSFIVECFKYVSKQKTMTKNVHLFSSFTVWNTWQCLRPKIHNYVWLEGNW